MISTELAVALRGAGLVWRPRSGDRFQLDEPEFEADVFTVSEMTIEPREYPTGRILAFNGTTEWALDSVALEDALWLPHESQLREMLARRLPVAAPAARHATRSRSCSAARAPGVRVHPSRPTRTRSPCWSCCGGSPDGTR